MELEFRVAGIPGPQGSKNAFLHPSTGRIIVKESSAKVKPWRKAVVDAAEAAMDGGWPCLSGPVQVKMWFYMARPKSHYGTGSRATKVKPAAPKYPSVKPDIDKLARSTLDALKTAGVYGDDALIVNLGVMKRYVEPPILPGAQIVVCAVPQ